jgi:hypothetical protein
LTTPPLIFPSQEEMRMKTVANTRHAVEKIGRRRRLRPMIPIDDAEAAALFLVEHMPPSIRVELGRLLVANGR